MKCFVQLLMILTLASSVSRGQTPIASVLQPYSPVLQGPENERLRQVAAQILDDAQFKKLSTTQRDQLNSEMSTIINAKGSGLRAGAAANPENNFLVAVVFLLNMERIFKMGSPAERQSVMIYPDKVREYLTKYLASSPDGRYAARARDLLKATTPKQ